MRLLKYKFFGDETLRLEPDDVKAAEDFNNMLRCAEYTDVEVYDVMRIG